MLHSWLPLYTVSCKGSQGWKSGFFIQAKPTFYIGFHSSNHKGLNVYGYVVGKLKHADCRFIPFLLSMTKFTINVADKLSDDTCLIS